MAKKKTYIFLQLIVLLYAFGSVFAKIAASKAFLSFEFCMLYSCTLLTLAVYAFLWQQILKKIPLNVAYANKSVTIVWGMVWGVVIFKERITVMNIIGAIVVLIGVLLIVTGEEKTRVKL